MRIKEDYDGAEPSGNSVDAMNLLRLAADDRPPGFRESAERTSGRFRARGWRPPPWRCPRCWPPASSTSANAAQIVLAGDRDAADTLELMRALHLRFVPNRVALLVDSPETRRALAAGIPAIQAMDKLEGRATAYVCRDFVCQLPVSGAAEFAKLLQ